MTELSDELLVAYVDGQLAREQTRAVKKVLAQDDVIARRVDALKEAHLRFEAAFEAILAGAVSEVMSAAPSVPPPERSRPADGLVKVGLATAAIGLALAALVSGWPVVLPDFTTARPQVPHAAQQQQVAVAPPSKQSEQPVTPAPASRPPRQAVTPAPVLQPPQQAAAPVVPEVKALPPTWQEQAMRAHALLSRASVEVSLESQGNLDLVTFQIAQAIGPAVRVPNLEAQGLKFMRAQLLRHGDKPLAQMLYLAASKAPVALYAMRGSGDDRPLFRREGTIGSVSWKHDGIAYLLAGEEDEATLLRLVEKIRHEPLAPEVSPPTREAPERELSRVPAEAASDIAPERTPDTDR